MTSAMMDMLNDASKMLQASKTVTLEVLDIHRNPLNTAPIVDIDLIKASIQEQGLLTPIVVYKVSNNNFRLLSGERRWTAHKELGYEYINAIVVEKPESEDLELLWILTMNSQRDFTENYKADRIQEYGTLYEKLEIKGIKKREWIAQHVGFKISPRSVQDYLTGDKSNSQNEVKEKDPKKEVSKKIKQLEKIYGWIVDHLEEVDTSDMATINQWGDAFKTLDSQNYDKLIDIEGNKFNQLKIDE